MGYFSSEINKSILIGLGASASSFLGMLISYNHLDKDWRDLSLYGCAGCIIATRYAVKGFPWRSD
tara:strand:+ start:367 stop:561 length:195 start_codon:yes stop_codon:yes gene_type:complete